MLFFYFLLSYFHYITFFHLLQAIGTGSQNQPKRIFNISNCGDNCAKYLLELADKRDIKVCLHHVMHFEEPFSIKVINERRRKVISDPMEYLMLATHYLRGDTNEG